MYKIIACDLDETLIRLDRTISPEDADAVKRATAAGVKFVVATGRGYTTVNETLDTLGLLGKEGEYVISFNGGAITENGTGKLLHYEGITHEQADELYRRGIAHPELCLHVYTKDMVYIYNLTDDEDRYLAGRMAIKVVDEPNLDFLKGQEIVKALYCYPDYDHLRPIEDELADITGDLDVSYSSNRYLEFNHRGVNKGAGLRSMAELLGVDMADTIAIGDNVNDLTMIQAAGLGVGVANAVDDLKAHCDYVCQATCDQSAVAEVIDKFVFGA